MKNSKIIVYGIGAFVALLSACIREGDRDEICRQQQQLAFYSLDRETNNVLHQQVMYGKLYAFNTNGMLIGEWILNPVPDLYTPDFATGSYDLALVANVTDSMEFARPQTRASGSVKMKRRDEIHYRQADDVHIGKLEKYEIDPKNLNLIDSVHVKRQVGMISVKVSGVQESSEQFRGELIVSGVAQGVDFFQTPLQIPVDVMEYGAIVDSKIRIDARCFSSVSPLIVTFKLVNIKTGVAISEVSKTLEEMLTPNKHIIIEYKIQSGNLAEFDMIVKDWDNNSDGSSGDAQ